MGSGHFQRAIMIDIDRAAQAIRDAEIEDYLEGFNQPPARHADQRPAGRYVLIPRWVVRG
jgi:hypothetical protein